MILIMMSYPDLFAYDAKYHKDCYNTYEGANNVKAAKRKVEREPDWAVAETSVMLNLTR